MRKAEFLLEVKAELDTIKARATPEEIGRLSLGMLRINSPSNCIYGLMTGRCDSDRAKELSPKVYISFGNGHSFSKQSLTKAQPHRVGAERYTALEKYLFMAKESTHKHLIDYLKGDINEIVLK